MSTTERLIPPPPVSETGWIATSRSVGSFAHSFDCLSARLKIVVSIASTCASRR